MGFSCLSEKAWKIPVEWNVSLFFPLSGMSQTCISGDGGMTGGGMKAPNHCAPISARRKGRNVSRSVAIRQLVKGITGSQ
jgi:hypothetical protein